MTLIKQDWVPLFEEFLKYIRINSKEVQAVDKHGAPLNLWLSQRMAIDCIVEGLSHGAHSFQFGKARQQGISTIFEALDIFWLATHDSMMGAYVIDKEKNLAAIRDKIKRYFNSFPKGFFGKKFTIENNNREFLLFSNGSRLDFLVAGVGKKATHWGEGKGYLFAHLTEVAKYGSPESLASFRSTLSESHPDRLFIYESTSSGLNHWKTQWDEFGRDKFGKRRLFIGFWGNDFNKISKEDPRYRVYGKEEPDPLEKELIDKVENDYGYKITREQLAWYRYRHSDSTVTESDMHENLPFTIEESFVATGHSFFQMNILQNEFERCGHLAYRGYKYVMGNDFWSVICEPIFEEHRKEEIVLRVWEEPVEGAWYVIGCDAAWGRGEDKDKHCLDDSTEILTKNGWRRYDEVSIGDKAVCFDLESEKYSYGEIQDKVVKKHIGKMYHFTSDGLDCLATPEHRMVMRYATPLRNGKMSKWKFKTADDAAKCANKGIWVVPFGGAPIGRGVDGLSLDMCRALGWILTDGHIKNPSYLGKGIRKRKKIRESITLVQAITTKKNNINISEAMAEVMKKICPEANVKILESSQPNRSPQLNCYVGAKCADVFLRWLDKDRNRIPRYILTNGSKEQLQSLFQGLLEGDGGWNKDRKVWEKVCPGHDSLLADDIQELASRLGYSATKSIQKAGKCGGEQWLIRLSKRTRHCIRRQKSYEEHYSGMVWCVTVPTGAFVARRNGKMFVTGNCIEVYRAFGDKLLQVAEYADNAIDTRQAAWVLAHLAGAYKNTLVNPEISGPGAVIITELENLREKMRIDPRFDVEKGRNPSWDEFLDNARWYLYRKADHWSAGMLKGMETTHKTKVQMMHLMRDKFVTDCIVVQSKPLVAEMMDVIQDGDSIEAPAPLHDDRVFATALAIRAWSDHWMMSLLQQGETYDNYLRAENGEVIDKSAKLVNNIILNYLQMAEEAAENPQIPPHQQWLYDKGFI